MGSRACFGKFFNDHNCVNCVLRDACARVVTDKAGAASSSPGDDVKNVESVAGSVGAPVADVSGTSYNDRSGASVTESRDNDILEEFNPEIHSTDDAGNPVYNKDGSLRKKRGRKPS